MVTVTVTLKTAFFSSTNLGAALESAPFSLERNGYLILLMKYEGQYSNFFLIGEN